MFTSTCIYFYVCKALLSWIQRLSHITFPWVWFDTARCHQLLGGPRAQQLVTQRATCPAPLAEMQGAARSCQNPLGELNKQGEEEGC